MTAEQLLVMKTLTEITNDEKLVATLKKLVGLNAREDTPEVAPIEERTPFTIDDAIEGPFLEHTEIERVLNV